MIVDIHPHVISTDNVRYPNSPLGGHKSDWSRERPVGVDQMVVAMDEAGIAKAALVQASTCYGHDNSYVADAVAAYPERFTGVFSVDVLAPDAPEKIRYWVGRKLTGLRLFTAGSTMPKSAVEPRQRLRFAVPGVTKLMNPETYQGALPTTWHTSGMNRIRLSTTVDAGLLSSARDVRAGITDAALIDEALGALLARHRSAEVDASYAAYDKHPVDEPDEWGDLASWRRAAGDS